MGEGSAVLNLLSLARERERERQAEGGREGGRERVEFCPICGKKA